METLPAPGVAEGPDARGKLPPLYVAEDGHQWSEAEYLRDPLLFYLNPYRQLGPLFRINFGGEDSWVMAGPEANDLVIRNRSLWRYAEAHSFAKRYAPREMFTLDGEEHRLARNIYTPGFRVDVVEKQTDRMRQTLVSLLESLEGQEVDLKDFLSLSFFQLTRAALGLPLPDELFEEALGAEQLILEGFREDKDDVKRNLFIEKFERVSQGVGECLRSGSIDETGMMGPILAGPRDGDPAFRHQLAIFFLAGPVNGAHTILWTLLFLQAYPEWLERARREATRGTALEHGDLYAALLEAERLRPPISMEVRVTGEDFTFAGYDVPKGTRLLHPITLVHFLDEVYERPFEFLPERHADISHSAAVHATFGMGPHRCVGLPLARQQSLVTLAELVRNWEIEMLFEPSLSYVFRDSVTPDLERLPARIARASCRTQAEVSDS